MKRVEEDCDFDRWEPIAWDEAIKTIANNRRRITAEYDKESMAMFLGTGYCFTKTKAMDMCYMCLPTCEKCFPKTLSCPLCGKKNTLAKNNCVYCGTAFTESDKEKARSLWSEKKELIERRQRGETV